MTKCVQCGKCCKEELCLLGELMFKTKTPPCPALIFQNGKYWCGIVLYADSIYPGLSDHLAFLLGIGKGCGAKPSDKDIKELYLRISDFEKKLKIEASAMSKP